METIEQEIKPMAEETAQALIDAFARCNNATQEFHDRMSKLFALAKQEAVKCFIEKTLTYSEKYTQATFLTRWYWLRKMKNLAKAIKEIEHLFNEENGTM